MVVVCLGRGKYFVSRWKQHTFKQHNVLSVDYLLSAIDSRTPQSNQFCMQFSTFFLVGMCAAKCCECVLPRVEAETGEGRNHWLRGDACW